MEHNKDGWVVDVIDSRVVEAVSGVVPDWRFNEVAMTDVVAACQDAALEHVLVVCEVWR